VEKIKIKINKYEKNNDKRPFKKGRRGSSNKRMSGCGS
jgi:hypothetical protein